MSENNENMDNKLENRDGKIIPIEISTEVQQSFLQYAMSVIVSRALPDDLNRFTAVFSIQCMKRI